MELEAAGYPGVRYTIRRMSFGRRLELLRRIRGLGQRLEYLNAGATAAEKLEAAAVAAEVDREYLRWGLEAIEGLRIDGEPADAEGLAERGPEDLCREIVARIRAESGLNEEERKNS
jgi:hypothetical protein